MFWIGLDQAFPTQRKGWTDSVLLFPVTHISCQRGTAAGGEQTGLPTSPPPSGAVCPLLMVAVKSQTEKVKGLFLKCPRTPFFYCSLGVSLCSDLFLKAYIGLFIISNIVRKDGEGRNYPDSQSSGSLLGFAQRNSSLLLAKGWDLNIRARCNRVCCPLP